MTYSILSASCLEYTACSIWHRVSQNHDLSTKSNVSVFIFTCSLLSWTTCYILGLSPLLRLCHTLTGCAVVGHALRIYKQNCSVPRWQNNIILSISAHTACLCSAPELGWQWSKRTAQRCTIYTARVGQLILTGNNRTVCMFVRPSMYSQHAPQWVRAKWTQCCSLSERS